MSIPQVQSAQLSVIIHATEDLNKVTHALDNICPRHIFETKIETRRAKGHYGNDIMTITISLRRRFAGSFLQHLWTLLPTSDRDTVLGDLDQRLDDDRRLHLRLDKQRCFQNAFRLKDQDPIKIEFGFDGKTGSSTNLTDQIRQVLESL